MLPSLGLQQTSSRQPGHEGLCGLLGPAVHLLEGGDVCAQLGGAQRVGHKAELLRAHSLVHIVHHSLAKGRHVEVVHLGVGERMGREKAGFKAH